MSDPLHSADRDEQRRVPRLPADGTVRVLLHTDDLSGQTENVSSAGILLLSDEPLRVSVEFGGSSADQVRSGRLVRVQRMEDGRSGLAIEFDAR